MINTKHLLIASVIGLLLPMSAAHAEYTAPRVLDGGQDAGARYFHILCPNGKKTAIRNYYEDYRTFKEGEVCYKDDGNDKCSKGWSLDDAAVKACKAKKI